MNNSTGKALVKARLAYQQYVQNAAAFSIKTFNPNKIVNSLAKREIQILGMYRSNSTQEERQRLSVWRKELAEAFSTASICPIDQQIRCKDSDKWKLDPDLTLMMANSRNETLLRYIWQKWRENTGPKMRQTFHKVVKLVNALSIRSGYSSTTERWLQQYVFDDPNFRKSLSQLWKDILPFYEELHAFVRFRLHQQYGSVVDLKSEIPAHFLGNMWAQSWENIIDIVRPYPDAPERPDITAALKRENWTVIRMFKAAESFFEGLGFSPLPQSFWDKSILTRIPGRDMACHGTAFDLADGDVRIKMCAKINNDDLMVIHHELGHIYYYLAYVNKSDLLRGGANPGFHEAVGDTIYLSSDSNSYYQHLHLLNKTVTESKKQRINRLLRKSIGSIALIPWAYLVDMWRWDIFDNKVPEKQQNDHWWQLRNRFQGIRAPVDRKPTDFDPLAKYHVAKFIPYIRYFVARFLQYQFHEALCQTPPLDQCSIYDNKVAGDNLQKMLRLGLSEPWPEALASLTGSKTMSAKAVMEYYRELYDWLKVENRRNNQCIGWKAEWPSDYNLSKPRCT